MKGRILLLNVGAMILMAPLCYAVAVLVLDHQYVGSALVAWMLFALVSGTLAAVQLLIGALFIRKGQEARGRSWLLAGMISGIVGPGMCYVAMA